MNNMAIFCILKSIFLLILISNIFTYEMYKEIKINNANNELISILNGLKVDLDHVHIELDNSINPTTGNTTNVPIINIP